MAVTLTSVHLGSGAVHAFTALFTVTYLKGANYLGERAPKD